MKTTAQIEGIDKAIKSFDSTGNYELKYSSSALALLMKRLIQESPEGKTTSTLNIWSRGLSRSLLDALKALEEFGYLTKEKKYVNSWNWIPTDKLIELY